MTTITTQLFPTSSKSFASLALRQITATVDDGIINRLQGRLSRVTKTRFCILTSSGRSAILNFLKAIDLKKGDQVILQSFTCSVVASSILEAGGTPVFADIDPASLNIDPVMVEALINKNTKGVIFQHTFGNKAGLEMIAGICKARRLFLLEDKAHTINDNQIEGTAAILSFGRSKWLTSISGGALITNDSNLFKNFKHLEDQKYPPSKSWTIRQLIQPFLIEYLIKPTLGKLYTGELIMELLSFFEILSKEVTREEKLGKLSKLVNQLYPAKFATLLLSQLDQLSLFQSTRLQAVKTYQAHLPQTVQIPGFKTSDPFLYFPVLVPNPQLLYERAKSKGVFLGNWYYPAVSPPGVDNNSLNYKPRDCPQAESISRRIVNLPTLLDLSQANKVVDAINTSLIL